MNEMHVQKEDFTCILSMFICSFCVYAYVFVFPIESAQSMTHTRQLAQSGARGRHQMLGMVATLGDPNGKSTKR